MERVNFVSFNKEKAYFEKLQIHWCGGGYGNTNHSQNARSLDVVSRHRRAFTALGANCVQLYLQFQTVFAGMSRELCHGGIRRGQVVNMFSTGF